MATNAVLLFLWYFLWDVLKKGSITMAVLFTVGFCNMLRQKLFADPNKPPVVLHWFPFIGSTTEYGMDPYKFFFDCQAKVSASSYPVEEGQG